MAVFCNVARELVPGGIGSSGLAPIGLGTLLHLRLYFGVVEGHGLEHEVFGRDASYCDGFGQGFAPLVWNAFLAATAAFAGFATCHWIWLLLTNWGNRCDIVPIVTACQAMVLQDSAGTWSS